MCEVCNKKATTHRRFYGNAGIKGLNLCENHDTELFLIGETRFLTIYKQELKVKLKKFCPVSALSEDQELSAALKK